MVQGDFAALDVVGMLICVPSLSVFFSRRCIDLDDGLNIVCFLVGVLLVTKPQFIFGFVSEERSIPVLKYFMAIFGGLTFALINFIVGSFSHIHWSTILLTRTTSFGMFTLGLLAYQRAWQVQFNTELPSLVISLTAAVLIGIVSNVLRTASVLGCHELEQYQRGSAGIMGNITNAFYIAFVPIFSCIFFATEMTVMRMAGIAVIAGSAATMICIKCVKCLWMEDGGGEGGSSRSRSSKGLESLSRLSPIEEEHDEEKQLLKSRDDFFD